MIHSKNVFYLAKGFKMPQRFKGDLLLLVAVPIIWMSLGCQSQMSPAAHEAIQREQLLPLTPGGFLKDGREAERVQGVCGTDDSRDLLNGDIYHGLPGSTTTEVTSYFTWSPYEKNVRCY